eukprot:TRINITY_DN3592_c0_g1_i2.p1 TRINITY_DN3592_c0_g1~~TRINITY_DN3592_c0_g1_i2.p1  ORF type:complete len:127 (-),score=36.55 TRINITY_DN3592_c0_g1_i2:81-461(-)
MSWQSYVDNNLVGSKHCSKAAIHGLDGGKWATSPGFTVSPTEAKTLIGGFKDPSGLRASGIHLSGTKYLCIRADDRSIYGKKGATGSVAVKTGKCVLVALYDESTQPGQCATVVEKLADYLIENGY